jgi:hypothetical protein
MSVTAKSAKRFEIFRSAGVELCQPFPEYTVPFPKQRPLCTMFAQPGDSGFVLSADRLKIFHKELLFSLPSPNIFIRTD